MIVREVSTLMAATATAISHAQTAAQLQVEGLGSQAEPLSKKAKPSSSLFASYDRRRKAVQATRDSGPATPVSAITIATTFVEKMVSIVSHTSGEDAW